MSEFMTQSIPQIFFGLNLFFSTATVAAQVCLFLMSRSIVLFIWHFCVLTELNRGPRAQFTSQRNNSCFVIPLS